MKPYRKSPTTTPCPAARVALVAVLALATAPVASASSHREAPTITEQPKVDATDFYMFRSYETGREGYVTVIANYLPLQDPYGGPNYFSLDPEALYEIHIDNDGDAIEDLTFQFRFINTLLGIALDIGPPGNQRTVPVPLRNVGPFGAGDTASVNVIEQYELSVVRGGRRSGDRSTITNAADGSATFAKPIDYIGEKSIPDYEGYVAPYVYTINIPGCETPGRVFVGQRKDPFVVNLGETFDLINLDPTGPIDGETDSLADKNITSLILEIPIECLVDTNPVIAGWTTASLRQARVLNPSPTSFTDSSVEGGAWTQVSRLANPLVNEVAIGLPDKDRFNTSHPSDDAQFLDYVTHPTLPALIEVLFAVPAPTQFPRDDLVQVFLTGVPDLNQDGSVGEMMRLNTSLPATTMAQQNPLGVIGGDVAGYPNGRRPGDDVVDISLRAMMGVLLPEEVAPVGQVPFTDGAAIDASRFDATFPYLTTPLPGSPAN